MYNIMVKMPHGKYSPVSYKFITKVEDNVTVNVGFETLEEVDEFVEVLLNGAYAKDDILVVEPIDYTVSTDIAEEESEPDTSTDPEPPTP